MARQVNTSTDVPVETRRQVRVDTFHGRFRASIPLWSPRPHPPVLVFPDLDASMAGLGHTLGLEQKYDFILPIKYFRLATLGSLVGMVLCNFGFMYAVSVFHVSVAVHDVSSTAVP